MFKQLIELWRESPTPIDEVVATFEEMLGLAHQMLHDVNHELFLERPTESFKTELYKKDTKINMAEQEIRRRILELLVSQGSEGPVASCLILMSIAKDVERIGDYTKNIYQVAEIKAPLATDNSYGQALLQVRDTLEELFTELLTVYRESQQENAQDLVERFYEAQRSCDKIVKQLLNEEASDGVPYAVLARYFKRCLAHLSNIATSVFMPVTKIDFFDEVAREKED